MVKKENQITLHVNHEAYEIFLRCISFNNFISERQPGIGE